MNSKERATTVSSAEFSPPKAPSPPPGVRSLFVRFYPEVYRPIFQRILRRDNDVDVGGVANVCQTIRLLLRGSNAPRQSGLQAAEKLDKES